jgi:hypothetical protein
MDLYFFDYMEESIAWEVRSKDINLMLGVETGIALKLYSIDKLPKVLHPYRQLKLESHTSNQFINYAEETVYADV